ncbi:Monoterpene epsilon-lactone hydrolase [Vanrija pseudolonga]|uniref:Monoterpene epsilon-lactone hydrolase n=1 Tax=Vanrija pseudolonga TaxID=143232 RepID=A0AAF0Y7C0_9TREE|nr:Monoterpene epsilon-lactone hydrolase [Vanrija pseudolonga]
MANISTLRTAPSPHAANGRSRGLAALLTVGAQLTAALTIPVWALTYLVTRPRIPFKIYLMAKIFRIATTINPGLIARESAAESADVPAKPLIPASAEQWASVTLTKVTAPLAPAFQDKVPKPAGVEAQPAPGFILTPKEALGKGSDKAAKGEKIVIYYHGGAYVVGHPLWTPFGVKLARDTGVRVYAAQYRKAVDKTSAWPAPLLDALGAWSYVTSELGFEPGNVVLVGDSAGGHLSLAVSSTLGAQGHPGPGGLALCSPWTDYTVSSNSWRTKGYDYLSPAWIRNSISSITRFYTPDAVRGAILSPALAPAGAFAHLKGTPVFLSVGTEETLEDEVRALARNLRGDGADVTVWDDEDALHDAAVFAPVFGTEESYNGFKDGVKATLDKL